MCKVYEFPTPKQLPEELVERFNELANECVELIDESITSLVGPEPTEEEYGEVMGVLMTVYTEAISNAIEKL